MLQVLHQLIWMDSGKEAVSRYNWHGKWLSKWLNTVLNCMLQSHLCICDVCSMAGVTMNGQPRLWEVVLSLSVDFHFFELRTSLWRRLLVTHKLASQSQLHAISYTDRHIAGLHFFFLLFQRHCAFLSLPSMWLFHCSIAPNLCTYHVPFAISAVKRS